MLITSTLEGTERLVGPDIKVTFAPASTAASAIVLDCYASKAICTVDSDFDDLPVGLIDSQFA